MKQLFSLALLLVLVANHAFTQKLKDSLLNLNNEELSHYYSKKSKDQKTGAFVMLGSGLLLVIIGGTMATNDMYIDLWSTNPQPPANASGGEVVAVIGAAMVVGSVPLFIASAKNKKRAKIALGTQTTPISKSFYLKQTSIGLTIPLGR